MEMEIRIGQDGIRMGWDGKMEMGDRLEIGRWRWE